MKWTAIHSGIRGTPSHCFAAMKTGKIRLLVDDAVFRRRSVRIRGPLLSPSSSTQTVQKARAVALYELDRAGLKFLNAFVPVEYGPDVCKGRHPHPGRFFDHERPIQLKPPPPCEASMFANVSSCELVPALAGTDRYEMGTNPRRRGRVGPLH